MIHTQILLFSKGETVFTANEGMFDETSEDTG
jgi:hypothetical protein